MSITVIVPVYNVEKYLKECIDSLLYQTEAFDEILLINDGSTDRSREICEYYNNNYVQIQLINQNNSGLSIARNVGIEHAKGDYIIFVDSDDFVERNMSYRLRIELYLEEVEVLYYNANVQYDIETKEKKDAFLHASRLNNKEMTGMSFFQESFPEHYTVSACVAVYQKKFLDKNHIRFPKGIYFEDHFWSLQVVTNAKKIKCISDRLYIRRCRENSIMSSKLNQKKCLDLVTKQDIIWTYLRENEVWSQYRDLYRKYVSYDMLYTYYSISHYPEQKFSKVQMQRLAEIFLQKCSSLFLEETGGLGENLAYLLSLKNLDRKNITLFFETTDLYFESCMQIVSNIKNDIYERMKKIPLNCQKFKVGIYGIGNHTKEFLHLYKKQIGEIQCDLFFVVSSVEKNCFFGGKKVMRYTDVSEDVDFIFLSSKEYQEEMKENLFYLHFPETKILSFYKKEDICDLVMVNWVLNQ